MTIEVRDLTKVYGKTLAVDHLSFEVRPGMVTGFLGPNGAGKSTTMRMILGLDRPTSGRSLIDGKPYHDLHDPLTRVGSLLDANWVHPNRSARAHLRWMARSNGLPTSRVDEVLELVGLHEVAGKSAGQCSLGMKQRLGLAGALLGDPGVLLFDEPVNGLDPEGILWIRTLMRNLAAQGRTVLVSSHLLSEMALTADHLVVIGRGRLIADAPTAEFISAATRSTVRVRSPRITELVPLLQAQLAATVEPVDGAPDAATVSGAAIDRIGEAAAAAGIALHELSPQNGSLEQAFIELTAGSAEFASHPGPSGTAPSAGQGPSVPGRAAQWSPDGSTLAPDGSAVAPPTPDAYQPAAARHTAPEGN